MPLTIATWNVNSIAARLPVVLRWLESSQPDVVCLQEIKCVAEKFPTEAIIAAGYASVVHGQPTYNGVATLVRRELAGGIGEPQRGFPGEAAGAASRFLAVTVDGIKIINVYIPNGQAVGSEKYVYKLGWIQDLRNYFDKFCAIQEPLALCGDFNVAPDPIDVYDPAVWEGQVLFSIPERQAIGHVKEWGLTDTFRQLNPDTQEFSWWDYRQAGYRRNLGVRIDHIWTTDPLTQTCRAVTIDREPRGWERPSDHTPVVASFA